MTIWRWLRVDGQTLHLVLGWKADGGREDKYDSACGGSGTVVAMEPDGSVRCLVCLHRVVVDPR